MGKKTSEKADDNLSAFKVGDRVKVNMHRGRIVDVTRANQAATQNRTWNRTAAT
jgi:hypothetical protein